MLSYERFGSGEPLVLVHGIGHRRQGWYPVVDRLAEERDVIIVDLPGHGESPALELAGRPVKEVLQSELLGFFAELGLEKPHIAGNSLGGRIALEAGADGLVSSVTALSPAGFWRSKADFAYIRGLFASVSTAARVTAPLSPHLARTTVGRAVMCGWINSRPALLDPDIVVGDAAGMVAAGPALRDIIASAYPFDSPVDDVPVTIAWGTKDKVLLGYQARRARRALPNATHLPLPGCGHVPMSDDPALVADVLLRGSRSVATAERAA